MVKKELDGVYNALKERIKVVGKEIMEETDCCDICLTVIFQPKGFAGHRINL